MSSAVKLLILTFLVLTVATPDLSAQTFGENVRVNDGAGGNQLLPSLGVDSSGTVHVVWEDDRAVDYDIYFARSTDGGQTWTDPNIRVNDAAAGDQKFPVLEVNSQGEVLACWVDTRNGAPLSYDIYFARSTDGGLTWTDPNTRVDDGSPGDQWSPSMAVDESGNIYVAWEDTRNNDRDIYFAKSTDGGLTWTSPSTRVDDGSVGSQDSPSVAVDGAGNISVVWRDERNGYSDIYFARSTDSGLTWTDPNVMANDPSFAGTYWMDNPTLSAKSTGEVYVSFDRWEHIYFTKSTDGGLSWLIPNIQVDDSLPGPVHNPAIAVDSSGALNLAWTDVRSYLQDDVYFARSTDGGPTWTDPNVGVNSDTFWNQRRPSLGVDDRGNIYVAWSDDRDDDYDIYFAKGTSTAIGEELVDYQLSITNYQLCQNYPNPVREETAIGYYLPCDGSLSLKIYDICGRLVRRLVDGPKQAGYHEVSWNGKDDAGRRVPSGIYFYRLDAGEFRSAQKMTILR